MIHNYVPVYSYNGIITPTTCTSTICSAKSSLIFFLSSALNLENSFLVISVECGCVFTPKNSLRKQRKFGGKNIGKTHEHICTDAKLKHFRKFLKVPKLLKFSTLFKFGQLTHLCTNFVLVFLKTSNLCLKDQAYLLDSRLGKLGGNSGAVCGQLNGRRPPPEDNF